MEYEIQRPTRHCTTTGREITPGEWFFSALMAEGANLVRHDYSQEAWKGPPEGAVGWWKSQVPTPDANKMRWAPNEVMLRLFDELQQQPARQDMRYVLALLLVRRRVMRLEEERRDPTGEVLVLHCPRRDQTYEVSAIMPSEARINEIQEELAGLLFGGGERP